MSTRILLIEDDYAIGALVEAVFNGNGSLVTWCQSGAQVLEQFRKGAYDICILDYTLPDINGLDLANHMKAIQPSLPLLFISANHELSIKYQAFEQGCDDYILKPFQVRELVLRVEAIVRRCKSAASFSTHSTFPAEFQFDYNARLLNISGNTIKLSGKEAHLLKILVDNFNQVVYRKNIMQEIWGNTDNYTSKCLDVYLSKIRKVIKQHSTMEIINEHGVGYKLIHNQTSEMAH